MSEAERFFAERLADTPDGARDAALGRAPLAESCGNRPTSAPPAPKDESARLHATLERAMATVRASDADLDVSRREEDALRAALANAESRAAALEADSAATATTVVPALEATVVRLRADLDAARADLDAARAQILRPRRRSRTNVPRRRA